MAGTVPVEATVPDFASSGPIIRKGIELAQSRGLERRLTADFSMVKAWDNEILFGGYVFRHVHMTRVS
jgi:hypothetical protein